MARPLIKMGTKTKEKIGTPKKREKNTKIETKAEIELIAYRYI